MGMVKMGILDSRCAVVTGAGRGIGRAVALRLAAGQVVADEGIGAGRLGLFRRFRGDVSGGQSKGKADGEGAKEAAG